MEDHEIILSIIIPYFNGASTINCCLNSIYSQGLEECDFEVICVDDCSTDFAAIAAIKDYKYGNAHPANLVLFRHEVNKRQGGARNTGIKAARGKWVLFIDQDDFFVPNTISLALLIANNHSELDFIMYDCVYGDGIKMNQNGLYSKLNQDTMTGSEFVQNQPVPWCPWCYIYNRKCLIESELKFAENVRFEDADFVLQYTANAKLARFVPLVLVYHVVHKEEQSYIGNDKGKIRDLLKIENRIAIAAEIKRQIDVKTGQAIMNHAIVHRYAALKRYLWRLPYNDIKELLKENCYLIKTGDAFVDFTNRNITVTAIVLSILSPLLHIAAALKHFIKNNKLFPNLIYVLL